MRRGIPAIALLLALLPASMLLAGAEGRLKGVVLDEEGNPVVGAQITLMAQEVSAVRQAKSKKGGKFVMIVADATRSYMIRIEMDGYQTIQEPIKLNIGGQLVKEWRLRKGQTVASASVVAVHAPGAKTYNAGARAFNEGDIPTALAKFEEAAAENPELVEAWQGQAMIHWSQERTAEALAAAEKIVALDPTNVVGLRVRYDAYEELSDPRASEALDALVAGDRTPGTAKRVFNTGVNAVRENDATEAIRRFEQAVELDPTLAPGYQVLGQLYNGQEEHDKAIAAAEKLLELSPGMPEAHSILYEAYRSTGDTAKAEVSWAVLKESKPEDLARALYDEGQSLFLAGQYPQAQEKLEAALEAMPDHAASHYTLGLCYLNTNQQAAAKEHLQRFLELEPNHPEAGTAREMVAFLE